MLRKAAQDTTHQNARPAECQRENQISSFVLQGGGAAQGVAAESRACACRWRFSASSACCWRSVSQTIRASCSASRCPRSSARNSGCSRRCSRWSQTGCEPTRDGLGALVGDLDNRSDATLERGEGTVQPRRCRGDGGLDGPPRTEQRHGASADPSSSKRATRQHLSVPALLRAPWTGRQRSSRHIATDGRKALAPFASGRSARDAGAAKHPRNQSEESSEATVPRIHDQQKWNFSFAPFAEMYYDREAAADFCEPTS